MALCEATTFVVTLTKICVPGLGGPLAGLNPTMIILTNELWHRGNATAVKRCVPGLGGPWAGLNTKPFYARASRQEVSSGCFMHTGL